MKRLFLILILSVQACYGQQLFDAMNESFQTVPKFTANLGTRNALLNNTFAKMRHVFVGINYQHTTKVGLTFNWMAKGFERSDRLNVGPNEFINRPKELRMVYIAPYIEYSYFKKGPWEGSIPVQVGVGKSFYRYLDGNKEITSSDWIALYEPNMTLQYRFWKYFAVGAGAGFRLMLVNNRKIDLSFNSPTYMGWFRIFFGDVYKDYVENDIE